MNVYVRSKSRRPHYLGLLRVIKKNARPSCRYYEHESRFAAMAGAIRVSRALGARLWNDSTLQCRQITGVGKLLGDKLIAAGFGDLKAIAEADARVLERVVDKAYPWGDGKKAEVIGMLPPTCSISVVAQGACHCPDLRDFAH